jgi:protein transport protein SEC24
MYALPRDKSVLGKVGIDMGLLCTPMALPSEDFVSRPKVYPEGRAQDPNDRGRDPQRVPLDSSLGPIRCGNCQAYANPYWGDDGACNFCGNRNKGEIQPTQHGTVDYNVSGPYVMRSTPVGATAIYALDATCPNLLSYVAILSNVGVQMGEHYQRQQGPLVVKPRIGCVLVSSYGIMICHLAKNGDLACSVMPDISDDPFCPLPVEEWTMDVSTPEGVQLWTVFMSRVWSVWQPVLKQIAAGASGYARTCGGAALAFMADALKDSGGRATWISWRRSNFGVGLIRDRELNDLKFYASELTERPLYCPLQVQKKLSTPEKNSADFYKKLGDECAKNRICVDIVMHTMPKPMGYLDLGTLGELCRISSGALKWIRAPEWQEQFTEELCRPLLSFFGTDAIFKIRCSEGIEAKSYLSCTAPGKTIDGGIVGSPELEISAVLPNTCVAVELEHRVGGIHKTKRMVYIQSATLYTAFNGQRRVRVSTLALRVSAEPSEIFRCSDFGAYTALLSRQAINHVWTPHEDNISLLDGARQALMKKCTQLLTGYRIHTEASASPAGQLLLPSKFQFLPLHVMSLLKSQMLRSALPPRGSEVRASRASPTADERAYALFHGAAVTPACAMLLVHPNIFPLMDLVEGDGEWQIPQVMNARSQIEQAAHHTYIQLPNTINPSIACMDDDNIYLIDDGMNLFIFVGQDLRRDIKAEFIESDCDKGCRVSTSSDAGQKVHRLLWQMRTHISVVGGSESSLRPCYPPTIVVLQHPSHRDPFDDVVMKLMVDDTISGCSDYSNFLVDMHQRVRSEVTNRTSRSF